MTSGLKNMSSTGQYTLTKIIMPKFIATQTHPNLKVDLATGTPFAIPISNYFFLHPIPQFKISMKKGHYYNDIFKYHFIVLPTISTSTLPCLQCNSINHFFAHLHFGQKSLENLNPSSRWESWEMWVINRNWYYIFLNDLWFKEIMQFWCGSAITINYH